MNNSTSETSPTITETMTLFLRDHFAGLAMAALIANRDKSYMTTEQMCREAYLFADNMLFEREE